ncbi:hypothetical protein A7982_12761 [Minicystis rosea]|nr:hypothetical protein A7982_12761 [Minicystis rosea]
MRLVRSIFLMLPLLVGCAGGAQAVLKSPVESKCGSAGLKGCPELTDGVIFYVAGEEAKGKDLLVKGAAENAPAKVKKFAKAIKGLKKVPGASSYTAKLVEVADILVSANKAPANAPADGDEAEDDEEVPVRKGKAPHGFDGARR